VFHAVPDLPEFLVAGREREYLRHFFDEISSNRSAISEGDLDAYADGYAKPGAMRCAMDVYRAFEVDAEENRAWLRSQGRCSVRCCVLSGKESRHAQDAEAHGK
jgi:hypothetical protein